MCRLRSSDVNDADVIAESGLVFRKLDEEPVRGYHLYDRFSGFDTIPECNKHGRTDR